jgi:hypothetical protein
MWKNLSTPLNPYGTLRILTNWSSRTGMPYLVFGKTYSSEYGGCGRGFSYISNLPHGVSDGFWTRTFSTYGNEALFLCYLIQLDIHMNEANELGLTRRKRSDV